MFEWRKTKYGYELVNIYSEEQLALLKYSDSEEVFYISSIENEEVKEWLDTNDLHEAKLLTVSSIITQYSDYINDYKNIIKELDNLILNR